MGESYFHRADSDKLFSFSEKELSVDSTFSWAACPSPLRGGLNMDDISTQEERVRYLESLSKEGDLLGFDPSWQALPPFQSGWSDEERLSQSQGSDRTAVSPTFFGLPEDGSEGDWTTRSEVAEEENEEEKEEMMERHAEEEESRIFEGGFDGGQRPLLAGEDGRAASPPSNIPHEHLHCEGGSKEAALELTSAFMKKGERIFKGGSKHVVAFYQACILEVFKVKSHSGTKECKVNCREMVAAIEALLSAHVDNKGLLDIFKKKTSFNKKRWCHTVFKRIPQLVDVRFSKYRQERHFVVSLKSAKDVDCRNLSSIELDSFHYVTQQ